MKYDKDPDFDLEIVLDIVEELTGISEEALLASRHYPEEVRARHLVWACCRHIAGWTWQRIAREFDVDRRTVRLGVDHTDALDWLEVQMLLHDSPPDTYDSEEAHAI